MRHLPHGLGGEALDADEIVVHVGGERHRIERPLGLPRRDDEASARLLGGERRRGQQDRPGPEDKLAALQTDDGGHEGTSEDADGGSPCSAGFA